MKRLKGMHDIFYPEVEYFSKIEELAKNIFRQFGFSEIITPILEETEVFKRSVGEQTDVVSKEMYHFKDRDGKDICLRPENTAAVVRSYIENSLKEKLLSKLYYCGPMFRRERPQKGRYRQFHQIGAEIIGRSDELAEIDLLKLLQLFFERLGVKGLYTEINSIGCEKCRPAYREKLIEFLSSQKGLCEVCLTRVQTNPLRVLDCKQAACQELVKEAPYPAKFLCECCSDHYKKVIRFLDLLSLPYAENKFLVRGLDYYTKTVFEIKSKHLGAQDALCAGGRYDALIKQMGGEATPAVGFSIGLERLVIVLKELNACSVVSSGVDLFIAALGPKAQEKALPALYDLRNRDVRVEADFSKSNLKKLMKISDKLQSRFTLIIGEEELEKGKGIARNMNNKEQHEISLTNIEEDIVHLLKQGEKSEA